MDFRLEAAALSEMAENTKDDPDFRVPAVDWDRTTKEVLTLEWIDGTPLSDRARLQAKGFDLPQLARAADPDVSAPCAARRLLPRRHASGQSVRRRRAAGWSPSISASWAGSARRSDCSLPKSCTASSRATTSAPPKCISKPATCRRHHSVESFAQAIRAIGEPIHNRTAEDISMARLLTLLFEVTGLFDMRTRPELLLLQKTMVVVEGVARSLDPKLDMWSTAEPVVREWMTRHLGPAGKLEGAAHGAAEVGRFIGNAPGLLTRGARVLDQLDEITRDGLVLSPQTVAEIGKSRSAPQPLDRRGAMGDRRAAAMDRHSGSEDDCIDCNAIMPARC